MKRQFLPLLMAVAFSGCAGLQQFPAEPKGDAEQLKDLDPEYQVALAEIYGTQDPQGSAGSSGTVQLSSDQKRQIRNRYIESRMAVIDSNFREFEKSLSQEGVGIEFGVSLVGVGVGAAGALVAETASQILSAVSGGLSGAQAAYAKSVLYDKAAAALLAQMRAGRKAVSVEIFERWDFSIDNYPLWMAKRDVEAYYFAGSIPGAIVSTAADAKVKEQQAEIALSKITKESVTPEMFAARKLLVAAVDGLSGASAKSAIIQLNVMIPDFKELTDVWYPQSVSAADRSGAVAKAVLKRLVPLTVRNQEDLGKWQTVIANL